ncbi:MULTISPECIES: hypothetical protein [Massilia]|jgi:hypothetical protein|uniref:hypothetical protein n=1 Tax=Massilia TaxID=149698 RepID=UPI00289D104B|nr:hypothetical protein [Massilia timonae]
MLTYTEFADGGSINKGGWFDSPCRVRLKIGSAGQSYPCEAFLRGKVNDEAVKALRADIEAVVLERQPSADVVPLTGSLPLAVK